MPILQLISPLALGILFAGLAAIFRYFGVPGESYQKLIAAHAFNVIVIWPLWFGISYWSRVEQTTRLSIKLLNPVLLIALVVTNLSFFFSPILYNTKYLILFGGDVSILVLLLFLLLNLIRLGFAWPGSAPIFKWFIVSQALCFFHTISFGIAAYLNPNLLSDQTYNEQFWLGSAHLVIQSMTVLIYTVWIRVWKIKLPAFAKFYYLPFFLFQIWACLSSLLPTPASRSPWLPYDNSLILIPAISSILLMPIFASGFYQFARTQTLQSLLPFALNILSYTCFGAMTGFFIYLLPLYRSITLNSLLMPGHFHPLVASGATLTFLLSFKVESQTLQRRTRWLLTGFATGVLCLAGGMSLAGWLLWPRRIAYTNELFRWPGTLMALGAGLACLTIFPFLFYLFKNSTWISESETQYSFCWRPALFFMSLWVLIIGIWRVLLF